MPIRRAPTRARNLRSAGDQRGATLIVSLILLLVLTIVGLSAIEGVNLQSQMARNSQFQVQSYQVALSEIQAQLAALEIDLGPLDTAVVDGVVNREGDDISMRPDHFAQIVSYSYEGEGLPPPGYSVDAFVGRRFELNSRAQLDSTGIFSDQTQGLNYAGPK